MYAIRYSNKTHRKSVLVYSLLHLHPYGGMVDATDLKSVDSSIVPVRVRLRVISRGRRDDALPVSRC